MYKSSLLYIFLCISLLWMSCSQNESSTTEKNQDEIIENPKIGDTIYITDKYPEVPVAVQKIMDSLKFCELLVDTSLPDSLQMYPCSSQYFGIFNNSSANWEKGFLMEAAQGVWAKSSRVFNIEKIDGTYMVTNDLKGQLLMMIPKENTKNDLIIRYYDSQVGTISVLHQWLGKNYKPVNVIMINDYPIKKEFQDSLNNVYLSNFIWGY